MRTILALLALLCTAATAAAQVPNFPQTLPANTVVGRLGIGPGPAQAIPFANLTGGLFNVAPGQIIANYTASTAQATSANWMASGSACPTWLSNYQLFANTAGAPTSIPLTVWDGAQCVSLGTLNASTHSFSANATAWQNVRLAVTAAYTVANADKNKTLAASGGAYPITFAASAGYDTNFLIDVLNEDAASAKTIRLASAGNYTLHPGQSVVVYVQNGVWHLRSSLPKLNVRDFGAKADGVALTNCATIVSSATLTCTGSSFSSSDIGKSITVTGAGASGATLNTTIATVISSTQINMTAASSTLTSGTGAFYATDDHAAITAAITAANNQVIAYQPTLSQFGSFVQVSPVVEFPPGVYYSSDANSLPGALEIDAYGAVFKGPSSFPSGAAFFQANASYGCSPTPCNGRYFTLKGGTFEGMPGHISIFNGNVGGTISIRDAEFWGATGSALQFQAESSYIYINNTNAFQNVATMRMFNRQAGGVAHLQWSEGTIEAPRVTGTQYANIFIDGCSRNNVNSTFCQVGSGAPVSTNQASSDIAVFDNILWGTLAPIGTPVDPAFISDNDGGRVVVRNSRSSQEAGAMALINNYTKWRTPNLSTNVDPMATIFVEGNELGADTTVANDKNAGIRLFNYPNEIYLKSNHGADVNTAVLAAGTSVNLTTALSGATTQYVRLYYGENHFPNATQPETALIPSAVLPYFVTAGGPGGSSNAVQINSGGSFSGLTLGTNNQVLAGVTAGSPSFRSLVGADLPNPSASTLGGIESIVCGSHTWLSTISTSGVPSCTQPAVTDLSNIAADGVVGNFTGAPASPAPQVLANCSNALTYNTTTHSFGCNTLAGTGTVTSVSGGPGVVTSPGPITAAGTVSLDGAFGLRNRLINPTFQVAQVPVGSTANGAYAYDQWYLLTQTANVTPATATALENGTPYVAVIAQSNAAAQRFGIAQVLENANVADLRGQTVSLSARVNMNSSTTLRYAILEWTGTADAPTLNVVNNWTSGTFTPGNFFLAANVTVDAVGSTALTANIPATISLTGTVSSSMNNLYVFVWTDSAQAQGVNLDIGKVQLEKASQPTEYAPRPIALEMSLCQRYYATSYTYGVAPGAVTAVGAVAHVAQAYNTTTTGGNGVGFRFPVRMLKAPAVSFWDVAGNAGKLTITLPGGGNTSVTANTASAVGDQGVQGVSTSAASGLTAGQAIEELYHYAANARM